MDKVPPSKPTDRWGFGGHAGRAGNWLDRLSSPLRDLPGGRSIQGEMSVSTPHLARVVITKAAERTLQVPASGGG